MAGKKSAKDGGKSRRRQSVKDLPPRGRQASNVTGGRRAAADTSFRVPVNARVAR